jgi:predicted site-specific integrase-resolvase
MKLLNVNDVAEITGISIGTLRCYIRSGKSPFKFRRLPSGRAVITQEELKNCIDMLPDAAPKKTQRKK